MQNELKKITGNKQSKISWNKASRSLAKLKSIQC